MILNERHGVRHTSQKDHLMLTGSAGGFIARTISPYSHDLASNRIGALELTRRPEEQELQRHKR